VLPQQIHHIQLMRGVEGGDGFVGEEDAGLGDHGALDI
jgi:hypothetical protein